MEWYEWLNPFKQGEALWNGLTTGDFDTGENIRRRQEIKDAQSRQDVLNFNAEFNDLFNNGGSSEDLMSYVMKHPDVQYDPNLINAFINRRSEDESYSRNLQRMKEAGINPLVGLGNVGSLGNFSPIGLNESVEKAQVVKDTTNTSLSMIKNILLIILALGRLAA